MVNFVHEDGALTVERIDSPSYLIRCRDDASILMSPYSWVCSMVPTGGNTCTIKGFLGLRKMLASERRSFKRISDHLGIPNGKWERMDDSGILRLNVEVGKE